MLIVIIVVLVVTNLAALAALVRLYLQPIDVPRPDPTLDAALAATTTTSGVRRVISIEILNPIELAGTRGRLAGLAGTIAPRLTSRIVHDQTLRIVKDQLEQQQVVADVRVHTLRPGPAPSLQVDTVERVDLGPATDDAER